MDWLQDANRFRDVYSHLDAFKNLRPNDQKFFNNLFMLLLFNKIDEYSDKYLAQEFNEPIETVGKRVRRIAASGLIVKETVKEYIDGRWRTKYRRIKLNPSVFAFMRAMSLEERVSGAAQLSLDNKGSDMQPGESNEQYAIRTGAIEVLKKPDEENDSSYSNIIEVH